MHDFDHHKKVAAARQARRAGEPEQTCWKAWQAGEYRPTPKPKESRVRNDLHRWTQQNELSFLDRMGTFGTDTPDDVADVKPETRAHLLNGYLFALIYRRRRWFRGADVPALRAYAERLLKEVTA